MTNELAPVDTKLATEAGNILELALAAQITTLAQQESAGLLLHEIKALKAKVNETFDPVCESTHKAWKASIAARNKHLTPLEDAERILKEKSGDFFAEQTRIQHEELRGAQEKAENEERLRREIEAKRMKKEGDKAGAKELLAQPVVVSVEAPPEPEKVAGITARTTYDFVIVDPNLIPREYLVPDMVKIRKIVQAMKEQTRIGGIRVVIGKQISVR